jgi:HEAT repeat protein
MLETNHTPPDLDQRPSGKSGAPVGDDLLPPVEPPSAGFIIQLFVVPALIVLVIVSVWFTFSWLVRRTSTRPQDLIQGLEQGPSIARWQRASELADMLRNERFADFKRSPESAAQLAGILSREIDQAAAGDGMDEEEITLRYFLARALGEFEVQEGIDVLLKAASTGRSPSEQLVRRGALEAIAVRAFNLARLQPPQSIEHRDLYSTLSSLADDEEPFIRSQAAYTLGQIGTPEAIERLEVMADDPDPDTRYNAAIGLAHHGNEKAVETLAEMLDVEELASVREETDEQDRAFKRAVIVSNALQAVDELARRNSSADFSLVIESLERLSEADAEALAKVQIPSRVVSDARRALDSLQARGIRSRTL